MNETTFQKISRKTGRKLTECKCESCKSQCRHVACLGTPEDIEKLIDAGYGDRIRSTVWGAGLIMGVYMGIIEMYQAHFDQNKGSCTFFENGLCQLHDKGLKPTEGRLSHHTITRENMDPKRALAWMVAKEWLDPANADTIERIRQKLQNS